MPAASICVSSACAVMLDVIVPILGNITAFLIFISPFQDVYNSVRTNMPSTTNPMPYPWIAANCLSWLFYGAFLKDPYVYFGNIIGYLLGLWYTLVSIQFGTEKFRMFASIILLSSTFLVFTGGFISFALLKGGEPGQTILGVVCIIILVFFYSSPLSDLKKVIDNRDASSINPLLAIASFFSSLFWGIYGFVLGDAFIWGPNFLGMFTSGIQLGLLLLYRKQSAYATQIKIASPTNPEEFDEQQQLYDVSPKRSY